MLTKDMLWLSVINPVYKKLYIEPGTLNPDEKNAVHEWADKFILEVNRLEADHNKKLQHMYESFTAELEALLTDTEAVSHE